MKTTSVTIPLGKLFDGRTFEIPEIQRDYAWDPKKEVSKLLEDLWKYHRITNHDTSPQYFIGTVILYSSDENNTSNQIMDGQQRITSITSLMAAIKTIIEGEARKSPIQKRGELEQIVDEIEDRYLFSDIDKGSSEPKLRPKSQETIQTIKRMIQMDGVFPEMAFGDCSPSIKRGKLYLALNWFYDSLIELSTQVSGEDYLSEIIKFYNTIDQRVIVTLTTTTTIGMAFQMFVSVNTKGMDLNSFDLLRGLLVAKSHSLGIDAEVGRKISSLSTHMKMVEKEAKSDERVKNCMTYWTEVRYGRSIRAREVPDLLDEEIRGFTEFSEFENMINQLTEFSIYYRALNTNKHLSLPGFIQHRRVLGFSKKSQSWTSQHMKLYTAMHCGERPPEEIDLVMSAVEWVSIRGGWSQIPNKVENIYPKYANKAINGEDLENWFDDFVASLTRVLDNVDINGFSHLEKEPTPASKATVLLHKVRKSYKDPGPYTKKINNCNACRLMPEGSPSPWNSPPEKRNPGSISGLVGNWFLMRDIELKQIGKFEVDPIKRVVQMLDNANTGIEVSTLAQIKEKLLKEENWNPTDIKKRTKELVMLFEEAWPKEFIRPKF